MSNYITKEEYLSFIEKHKNEAHWSSRIERWRYHEKTIEFLKFLPDKRILEAGTMGINVCKHSDTIDLDITEAGWPLYYKPTYDHDLRILPWPIEDKQYDVFIALRVFHHLRDKPTEYFKEMCRIADHIILAFPEQTAAIYRNIERPAHEVYMPDVNTVILYYSVEEIEKVKKNKDKNKDIPSTKIKKENNLIYKTLTNSPYTKELIDREIYWLKKLEKYNISPKLIKQFDNTIIMSNCGRRVTEEELRAPHIQKQLLYILRILLENKCFYNDFSIGNLLIDDNLKLSIIDFSWCPLIKEDFTCNNNVKSKLTKKPWRNYYYIFNIIGR
jgi:hypothetical protein